MYHGCHSLSQHSWLFCTRNQEKTAAPCRSKRCCSNCVQSLNVRTQVFGVRLRINTFWAAKRTLHTPSGSLTRSNGERGVAQRGFPAVYKVAEMALTGQLFSNIGQTKFYSKIFGTAWVWVGFLRRRHASLSRTCVGCKGLGLTDSASLCHAHLTRTCVGSKGLGLTHSASLCHAHLRRTCVGSKGAGVTDSPSVSCIFKGGGCD